MTRTIRSHLRVMALLLPLTAAGFAHAAPTKLPSSSNPTKMGVEAASRGDTATAIKLWSVEAAKGDPDAQFNLAQAYKLGRGVPQDLTMAESLYKQAADRGHLQAADFYGLLLFQRGEHAAAMPYVKAAADHGEPRAQYFLGLSYFNGDSIAKDWVRAYALVSLATQQGLAPAKSALAQMDQYIPIEQRQQAISLSSEIAAQAESTRARQLASMDLGVTPTPNAKPAAIPMPQATRPLPPPVAVAVANPTPFPRPNPLPQTYPRPILNANPIGTKPINPNQSGAILPNRMGSGTTLPTAQRPQTGQLGTPIATAMPKPIKPVVAKPIMAKPVDTTSTTTSPSVASTGSWRVQLGAFGVASNADAMWNRVKNLAEISGHPRINAKAGAVTKLLAGGYSSEAAQNACRKLAASGISCIAIKE